MSAIDRLFDMLNRQSLWTTTMPTWAIISAPQKIRNAVEEFRIVPDDPRGPMLEIVTKNESGVELFKQRYNLTAVDELIGKLIKYRDLMAAMTIQVAGGEG